MTPVSSKFMLQVIIAGIPMLILPQLRTSLAKRMIPWWLNCKCPAADRSLLISYIFNLFCDLHQYWYDNQAIAAQKELPTMFGIKMFGHVWPFSGTSGPFTTLGPWGRTLALHCQNSCHQASQVPRIHVARGCEKMTTQDPKRCVVLEHIRLYFHDSAPISWAWGFSRFLT